MKYYIIAGEASGDLHASNLMRAIKEEDRQCEFRFYGGDKMAEVGGTLVKHYRQLAYMGFIPVLLHLPTILKNMSLCKEDIARWKPDVVILVDYPGFNLDIAKYVHKHRICKVFYYISPKIWAWKEYRIKNIRRDVDELFSILPFEVKWFADRGYPIHYVGNPCVDAVAEAVKNVPDVKKKKQIAILAGSRKQEIKDNLRIMLKAASAFTDYSIVIAGAPGIDRSFYDKYKQSHPNADIRFGETYTILRESSAALVTSGTATLETAILGIPQVVCYYTAAGKLVSWLRSKILKVKYISLVNLVADAPVVEELVADRMTEDNVKEYLKRILPEGSDRQRMLNDYKRMNDILGGEGASAKAAHAMVKILKKQQTHNIQTWNTKDSTQKKM